MLSRRGSVRIASIPFSQGITSFSPILPPPPPPGPGPPPGPNPLLPIILILLLPVIGLVAPVLVAPPAPLPEAAAPSQEAVATPGVAPSTPQRALHTAAPTPPLAVRAATPARPLVLPAVARRAAAATPGPATFPKSARPPGLVLPYVGANLWMPITAGIALLGIGLLLRRGPQQSDGQRSAGRLVRQGGSGLAAVSLLAGALLVATPAGWVALTALMVGRTQTAALAAWETTVTVPPSRAPRQRPAQQAAASPGLVLTIPRVGLRRFVPEGATPEHLRRFGVGRITWTSLPPAEGMIGIAGHRTTYGAPFFRLDSLRIGDLVLVDYGGRRYHYTVRRLEVVRPDRVDVLRGEPGRRGIALITCTPIYSASFRLVVLGNLLAVTPQAAAP